jgi:hypothetical protein
VATKHRRSERKAFGRAPSVTKASQSEAVVNTGTFGAFRAPELVGVSDTVRIANRDLARRARRAEKAWLRSLPKGVKV